MGLINRVEKYAGYQEEAKREKLKNFKFNFNSSLWIGFALAFLYLPLVIMAIFSFNDSKSLSSWSGFHYAGIKSYLLINK